MRQRLMSCVSVLRPLVEVTSSKYARLLVVEKLAKDWEREDQSVIARFFVIASKVSRFTCQSGVKRILGLIYNETHGILKVFLENVICDTVTYTEHVKWKTAMVMDIVYGVKHQGRTLYGFGG